MTDYYFMWGITIYLMHFVDYFRGRKYKMKCRSCGRVFKDEKELDTHIRIDHK
jgi:rRNA maturation endonuclease Nob1